LSAELGLDNRKIRETLTYLPACEASAFGRKLDRWSLFGRQRAELFRGFHSFIGDSINRIAIT